MKLAELQKPNSHIAPLEFERPHSCAEDFSRRWKVSAFNSVRLPIGMLSVVNSSLDQEQIRKASLALAESIREICIWDIKQDYEPRGPWGVCGETFIQRLSPQEDIWQRLSVHFSFTNGETVIEFLERNHFLVEVLFEVRRKINQYFSTETQSCLEVFTDPEDDGGDSKLFALILTALPSREASARLDLLDQEWWLGQPYDVKRAMNIDIDYIDGGV